MRILCLMGLVSLMCSTKLFLIGGALADTGQIWTAMGNVTGKPLYPGLCSDDWTKTVCPKVAVVTSAAPSEKDGNDAFSKDTAGNPSYYTMFRQNGFTSRHISSHIDNYKKSTDLSTADGAHNLNIMQDADIIFFNGGDQARHARTWLLDNGLCNPLFCKVLAKYNNDQVVFAGTSAGTMIMSNPTFGQGISFGHLFFNRKAGLATKSVRDGDVNGSGLADTRNGTKGLQYQDNGGKLPGFDVYAADYLFDSHFDARGRLARLVPDLKDTNKSIGVGVDQNTAFYLTRTEGKVFGQNGVWVVDNTQARYQSSSSFQVQNVYLWYLTSGDVIQFPSKALTSSKQLITTPSFEGSMNSTHTTDAYQMTKLITRLVDQVDPINYGSTKAPSGYNSSTPVFHFQFGKLNATKGYKSNGKHSIDKISIAIRSTTQNLEVEVDQ